MRSVCGTVVSSKPISLSKAAVALSSFVSGGTGASRDVAAHLKRASLAFDDLVFFHRDLRARRRSDIGKIERKKKKGDKEKPEVEERDGLGEGNLTEVESDDGHDGAKGEKEKWKRKAKATNHGRVKESLETEEVSSKNMMSKMKPDRKDESSGRELNEQEGRKKSKKKRKIQAA